jgi:hypothetical protein
MRAISKRIGLWIRSMLESLRTASERIAGWIGSISARITIGRWAVVAALLAAGIAGFSYYQASVTRDLLSAKLDDELGKKVEALESKLARPGPPSSSALAKPQSR